MPPCALLGLGDFGLEAASRAKSAGIPVRVLSPPPAPGPAAGSQPGIEITHSVQDFAAVQLPPQPSPRGRSTLDGTEYLAPPEATRTALEAALEATLAQPPPWLPAPVRQAPEAWLASLGEPPRPDRISARLLWPRLERSFASALETLVREGPPGSLWIALDGAEPAAAGLALEALKDAARLLPAHILLAPPPVAPGTRDSLAPLLDELEELARGARPPPVLVLAPGFDLDLLPLLLAVTADPRLPGVPRGGLYRGRPLAFAVAGGTCLHAPPAAIGWHVSLLATRAALRRLLARPSPDSSAGVTRSRDILCEHPLPAFARLASRPFAELTREIRGPSLPSPPAGEDPDLTRRRLDAFYARRSTEIANQASRHDTQGKLWLHGGTLSRLGAPAAPGFLGLLAQATLERVAHLGLEAGIAFLGSLAAELRGLGAGAPRTQLAPRIAELEKTRAALVPAPRPAPGRSLASLLGRTQPAPKDDTWVLEYTRHTAELLRLREIDSLLGSACELWDLCLEAVKEVEAELLGMRQAAGAALDAVERAGAATAVPETVPRALAAEARNAPERLLHKLMVEGGRRAASPQAILDELWSAARAPLSGSEVLARLPDAGVELRRRLERAGPAWERDRLPRRLRPAVSAWLNAPAEPPARTAAAELPFPTELRVDPGAEGLALLTLEAGIPRFALHGEADPRDPLAAGSGRSLRDAVLQAPDLASLRLADRSLAGLEGSTGDAEAPETELFLALRPVVAALRKVEEVSDPADRTLYLEEARAALEAWAAAAAEGFVEPEREGAARASARWREELARELDASRGRAGVRLELRARRLVFALASLTVEVEVHSTGPVPAEGLEVTLEPGPGYRVLGGAKASLGRLPAGASAVARFRIKPQGPGSHELSFVARHADRASPERETRLADRVEVFEARPGFRRIGSNPYIAGPPVKTDRMFYGRADVFAFIRDNLQGRFQSNVLILHGNRRTGKSSILCQLERGDAAAPFVPVYLDLQGLGRLTTGSLFHQLVRRITRALAGRGIQGPDPPARATLEGRDAFEAMNEWLDELAAIPFGAPRLLLMLDEFEILEIKAREGRIDVELFGWLRSLMQHADNLAFILAGTHRLSDLDPELWAPLHALALYRHVSFLGEAEARSLIVEPVRGELDYDDLAVEGILRLTAGHPYYTQLLCQLLVSHLNEAATSNVATLEDLGRATERLLQAGGGQFAYEWNAPDRGDTRLMLAALGEAADVASVWVELDDIARRAGLGLAAADEAARDAVARDLVVRSGSAYRIRMDLFRLWLRREKPVARARA